MILSAHQNSAAAGAAWLHRQHQNGRGEKAPARVIRWLHSVDARHILQVRTPPLEFLTLCVSFSLVERKMIRKKFCSSTAG